MARTLVTGSAGFIGGHVVNRLIEQNEAVVGIDSNGVGLDDQFVLDIRDPGLSAFMARMDIQRVIHLAAKVGVRDSIGKEKEYFETNVLGTINLLNACVLNKVERVVLASSSSVYGDSETVTADNQHFYPLSPYAASKVAMEMIARSYRLNYDLKITILRLFSVYGPNIRRDLMIYRIMDALINQTPITLYANGTLMRDWTYVDDVAWALVNAARIETNSNLYNVGSDDPASVLDVVIKLAKLADRDPIIRFEEKPLTEPAQTRAGIVNGLDTFVSVEAHTSLDDGLKATWDWFVSHMNRRGD